MSLTTTQQQALKADIAANANTIPAGQPWTNSFAGVAVKDVPNSGDGNATVAGWYSQTAAPDFFVWRDLPMDTVLALIAYANMTPADAAPAAAVPSAPTEAEKYALALWQARSLACQGKQFNLQNLTIGRTTAPMKRANYRAAMQDCLTNLPAGGSGALIPANWVGVRDGAKFQARYIEKLLATGSGVFATPADLGYEGTVSGSDVENARNS